MDVISPQKLNNVYIEIMLYNLHHQAKYEKSCIHISLMLADYGRCASTQNIGRGTSKFLKIMKKLWMYFMAFML